MGKKTKTGSISVKLKTNTVRDIDTARHQCTGDVLENKIYERENSTEKRCEN